MPPTDCSFSKTISFSATLVISKKHPALAGHFPDNPIVPGIVILDRLIRLWQKKSNLSIKHITNAKFTRPLRAEVICTVQYSEKGQQKIDFLVLDEAQNVICKGLFCYDG